MTKRKHGSIEHDDTPEPTAHQVSKKQKTKQSRQKSESSPIVTHQAAPGLSRSPHDSPSRASGTPANATEATGQLSKAQRKRIAKNRRRHSQLLEEGQTGEGPVRKPNASPQQSPVQGQVPVAHRQKMISATPSASRQNAPNTWSAQRPNHAKTKPDQPTDVDLLRRATTTKLLVPLRKRWIEEPSASVDSASPEAPAMVAKEATRTKLLVPPQKQWIENHSAMVESASPKAPVMVDRECQTELFGQMHLQLVFASLPTRAPSPHRTHDQVETPVGTAAHVGDTQSQASLVNVRVLGSLHEPRIFETVPGTISEIESAELVEEDAMLQVSSPAELDDASSDKESIEDEGIDEFESSDGGAEESDANDASAMEIAGDGMVLPQTSGHIEMTSGASSVAAAQSDRPLSPERHGEGATVVEGVVASETDEDDEDDEDDEVDEGESGSGEDGVSVEAPEPDIAVPATQAINLESAATKRRPSLRRELEEDVPVAPAADDNGVSSKPTISDHSSEPIHLLSSPKRTPLFAGLSSRTTVPGSRSAVPKPTLYSLYLQKPRANASTPKAVDPREAYRRFSNFVGGDESSEEESTASESESEDADTKKTSSEVATRPKKIAAHDGCADSDADVQAVQSLQKPVAHVTPFGEEGNATEQAKGDESTRGASDQSDSTEEDSAPQEPTSNLVVPGKPDVVPKQTEQSKSGSEASDDESDEESESDADTTAIVTPAAVLAPTAEHAIIKSSDAVDSRSMSQINEARSSHCDARRRPIFVKSVSACSHASSRVTRSDENSGEDSEALIVHDEDATQPAVPTLTLTHDRTRSLEMIVSSDDVHEREVKSPMESPRPELSLLEINNARASQQLEEEAQVASQASIVEDSIGSTTEKIYARSRHPPRFSRKARETHNTQPEEARKVIGRTLIPSHDGWKSSHARSQIPTTDSLHSAESAKVRKPGAGLGSEAYDRQHGEDVLGLRYHHSKGAGVVTPSLSTLGSSFLATQPEISLPATLVPKGTVKQSQGQSQEHRGSAGMTEDGVAEANKGEVDKHEPGLSMIENVSYGLVEVDSEGNREGDTEGDSDATDVPAYPLRSKESSTTDKAVSTSQTSPLTHSNPIEEQGSFLGSRNGCPGSGRAHSSEPIDPDTPGFSLADANDEDLYRTFDDISRDVLGSTSPLPSGKPLRTNESGDDVFDRKQKRGRSRVVKGVSIPAVNEENLRCYFVQVPDEPPESAQVGERTPANDPGRVDHDDPETQGSHSPSLPLSRAQSSGLSDLGQTPTPPLELTSEPGVTARKQRSKTNIQGVPLDDEEFEPATPKKRRMTGATSKHWKPEKRTKYRPSRTTGGSSSKTALMKAEDSSNEGEDAVKDDIDYNTSEQPSKKRAGKRKSTPKKSPHFQRTHLMDRVDLPSAQDQKNPRIAGVSNALAPPITSEHFGIIQEKLWREPFWLLVAVRFLNCTTGRAAIPIFWDLKNRYVTPEGLAKADVDEVLDKITCLGFQNQRSQWLVKFAQIWEQKPPMKGIRYRTRHYPKHNDQRQHIRKKVVEGDEKHCTGALEIAHLPGCGAYAWDSWRIFCRDVLRGVAQDYKGLGAVKSAHDEEDFEPEWMRVLPLDKELRVTLRWMWLREGWVWDHGTGEKRRATDKEMESARRGEMELGDKKESEFAERAVKAEQGMEVLENVEVEDGHSADVSDD